MINATKTQLIILKSPRRKLPDDFSLEVGGVKIEPARFVQLLGLTIDQHLTFREHIEVTVKKCNAALGVLNRAAQYLPQELLKLAYLALVRSHAEYCSAVFNSAARSNLLKLDTIQRKAARVVCHAPRDAHADPLLEMLQLKSLQDRRDEHILQLVDATLAEKTHPALRDLVVVEPNGRLREAAHRTVAAGRGFRVAAARLYNSRIDNAPDLTGVH